MPWRRGHKLFAFRDRNISRTKRGGYTRFFLLSHFGVRASGPGAPNRITPPTFAPSKTPPHAPSSWPPKPAEHPSARCPALAAAAADATAIPAERSRRGVLWRIKAVRLGVWRRRRQWFNKYKRHNNGGRTTRSGEVVFRGSLPPSSAPPCPPPHVARTPPFDPRVRAYVYINARAVARV